MPRLIGPAEALAAYEQALSLNPTDPDYWNSKGNALSDLGRPAEALAAYEQALSLNPNEAMVWRNFANTLIDARQYERAGQASQRAITLQPGNARGHFLLGRALNGLGRYAEALAVLQRLNQDDPPVHEAIAVSLRGLGRDAEA